MSKFLDADLIEQYRTSNSLTKKEFCARCEIDRKTLNRIENSKRVSSDTTDKIAKGTGLNVAKLECRKMEIIDRRKAIGHVLHGVGAASLAAVGHEIAGATINALSHGEEAVPQTTPEFPGNPRMTKGLPLEAALRSVKEGETGLIMASYLLPEPSRLDKLRSHLERGIYLEVAYVAPRSRAFDRRRKQLGDFIETQQMHADLERATESIADLRREYPRATIRNFSDELGQPVLASPHIWCEGEYELGGHSSKSCLTTVRAGCKMVRGRYNYLRQDVTQLPRLA